MTRDERFQSLYRGYYRRIVRYLMTAFRLTEEDAEELAQDAFVRFYQAMDEYRGEAEWAFLETTAKNVALNRVRSLKTIKRNANTVDLDDPNTNLDPPAPKEKDYAERQEELFQKKRLHDGLSELPSGQRECMQLWLDGLTYDEIALALRISMDAVKSRLRDARKALRARLGDAHALPEDDQ